MKLFLIQSAILIVLIFCGCALKTKPNGGYLQIGKLYWDLNKFDMIELNEFISKTKPIATTPLKNKNIIYIYPKQPYATIYLTDKSGNFSTAYDVSSSGNLINYEWINTAPSTPSSFRDFINNIRNRKSSNQ
jgi:hypothetical protein